MQQRGAALDVAKELQTKTLALACPLNKPGNVGDCVAGLARLHHAEVRMQGSERVIGDFGFRRGHRRDQTRLTSGGVTHESNIGDDFELEENVTVPPRRSEQCEAWRLALGARKGGVAQTSLTTGCDDEAHVRLIHINELVAIGVFYDGPDRHKKRELIAGRATLVVTLAWLTVLGLAVWSTMKAEKCGGLWVTH